LSPDARRRAVVLSQSLETARTLIAQGQRDAACIVRQMADLIRAAGGAIDYVALVDPETLGAVMQIDGPVLAVLAVKFDGTRLIDNAIM
jgi:pantoate--beta-alanine ligase